jgi:predicted NUDIX family NTP pyrophosphohydrolase
MFQREGGVLRFLLVHPGGPFWAKKDEGAWTIPKGEVQAGEDHLSRARIEFEEELGMPPQGDFIELGSIRQKGGKTVYGWAVEGSLPRPFVLRSNTFQMEWPPRSGKMRDFPEIDRAEFFAEELARRKINVAQLPLLDRLLNHVSPTGYPCGPTSC